jgi:cytochrome d ubiquinol oxidase subunit II
VTVSVLAGAAILFPSLALLFRLVLGGNLGRGESAAGRPTQARSLLAALAPGLLPGLAIACLVAGIGFLTIADAAWAHTIGVVSLLTFIVVAFPAALPPVQKSRRRFESGWRFLRQHRSADCSAVEDPDGDGG